MGLEERERARKEVSGREGRKREVGETELALSWILQSRRDCDDESLGPEESRLIQLLLDEIFWPASLREGGGRGRREERRESGRARREGETRLTSRRRQNRKFLGRLDEKPTLQRTIEIQTNLLEKDSQLIDDLA